ncbi:hypothetical protein GEMRC1_008087 [Eukaryota sp. GEM-RC1]
MSTDDLIAVLQEIKDEQTPGPDWSLLDNIASDILSVVDTNLPSTRSTKYPELKRGLAEERRLVSESIQKLKAFIASVESDKKELERLITECDKPNPSPDVLKLVDRYDALKRMYEDGQPHESDGDQPELDLDM